MIKIDKGIPLPNKFPFAEMAVGDSFLIPAEVKSSTVSVSASRCGEPLKKRFTVRKTPQGFRCWRIA